MICLLRGPSKPICSARGLNALGPVLVSLVLTVAGCGGSTGKVSGAAGSDGGGTAGATSSNGGAEDGGAAAGEAGSHSDSSEPVEVEQVAVDDLLSCALLSDGRAKCWGYNPHGEIGVDPECDPVSGECDVIVLGTPTAVEGLSDALRITAGLGLVCAIIEDRTARCWGYNGGGALGDGTTTNSSSPVVVAGLTDVIDMIAGYGVCALLGDGTVACWGGTNGHTPQVVSGLANARGIAGDPEAAVCALLEDGTVACWGSNEYGQLGDGTTTDSSTPVEVQGLSDVAQIAGDTRHFCARLEDGTVECWGYNEHGELGDGTTTDSSTPVVVKDLSAVIELASRGSCAVLGDGTARCWGWNYVGQLGDGTTTDSSTPVEVQGLSSVVQVESVPSHNACALLQDGTVKCWGNNFYAQLGDGTRTNSSVPVTVVGLP